METARKLNRNLETMAWGAFFIWWGITELFQFLPHGVGAIGIGLIWLGLNAARSLNGISTSGLTTKLGILGFSRSIAVTYAKQQIRCNTVIPGLMHTPLVETRLAKTIAGGDVAALIASRNAQVPTGKMGDAWDVAQDVLFLVSDEARYVTAAEIAVDGGLSAASR